MIAWLRQYAYPSFSAQVEHERRVARFELLQAEQDQEAANARVEMLRHRIRRLTEIRETP